MNGILCPTTSKHNESIAKNSYNRQKLERLVGIQKGSILQHTEEISFDYMWAHARFLPIGRGKAELIHPLNPTSPAKSPLVSVIHTDLPFLCHSLQLHRLCLSCLHGSGQGVDSRRVYRQGFRPGSESQSSRQDQNRWWMRCPGLRKRKNKPCIYVRADDQLKI